MFVIILFNRCLLVLPQHLLPETRFEVQVMSCCLLLNLVEHSEDNRAALMKTKAPVSLDDEDEDEDDLFNGRSISTNFFSLYEVFDVTQP